MALKEKVYITAADFLEIERKSLEKHEYYRGEIFSMAEASVAHNRIARNILTALSSKLQGKKCEPFGSDLRIHIPFNTLYTYPDISIICGSLETTDAHQDTVTNPGIIIEILSESTRNYDKGAKFFFYQKIESLREYFLIDSTGPIHVEKYSKTDDGFWHPEEYHSLEEIVLLKSIDETLEIKTIYDGVY